MCTSPNKIADIGFVACRECWQCREHKVDDWVGRNIAESRTAKAAHAVSLTYGRDKSTGGVDHMNAAVLTYSDVQKMLKHLRVDGYPVRYFVAGEYGSTKGRAHWHILLYWQDRVPDGIKLRTDCHSWDYWPHGFSYWDKMSPQSVRYACKYLLKDSADEAAQIFGPMPSKKPPLGDAYFRQLAARYVEQGLAPQSLFYSFPDVRRVPYGTRGRTERSYHAAAKPVQFMMRDKTAENFLQCFGDLWRERYNDEPPRSEPYWAYEGKKLKDYVESITLPKFAGRPTEIDVLDMIPGSGPVTWNSILGRHQCEIGGELRFLVQTKRGKEWRASPRVWENEVFETKDQLREREIREGIRF